MSLLYVVIVLVVIGVLLWAVTTYVPMDARIKNILGIVVVLCVLLWLLNAFGILGYAEHVKVPHV